jgi:hypothetical protein
MNPRESLIRFLITFGVTIMAAVSGYFTAYAGLRVELAGKAEERYVAEMDIRLSRLEATINERFATKDDLSEFKSTVVSKLTAIEVLLAGNDSGLSTEYSK